MMNLIPAVDVTASALAAEKVRLDVVSQNIANAHTTRGANGKPYARKTVSFEAEMNRADGLNGVGGASESRRSRRTNRPVPWSTTRPIPTPTPVAWCGCRMSTWPWKRSTS